MNRPSSSSNGEERHIGACEVRDPAISPTYKSGLYHHELDKCLDRLDFHPTPDGLCYLEVEFQEGSQEPIVRFGPIREYNIPTFLERNASEYSKTALRILFSSLDEMKSPSRGLLGMERETFLRIIDLFSLPMAYADAMADQAGVYSRTHPPAEEHRFVYIIKPPPATLTFAEAASSYDANTGLTYGFVCCNVPDFVDFLLQRLRLSAAHARHPLLLLTIYLEWQGRTSNQERTQLDGRLLDIEDQTGHTIFYDKNGQPTGDQTQRIDSSLSRKLSVNLAHLSYNISMVNLFNSSVQTLCEKALLQYLNELDDLQQEAVCASTKELRQRIEIVQSICANNALRFTAYEKRLELQMGVVHNLIAQEDNMRNIELVRDSKVIATASKRDSSIMKVLAVLGTLFLPASFIATLFSMPLLAWDGDNGHTVQSQFWVYLAVTIPLTLVVMSLSLLWVWWNQKKSQQEEHSNLSRLTRPTSNLLGLNKVSTWQI